MKKRAKQTKLLLFFTTKVKKLSLFLLTLFSDSDQSFIVATTVSNINYDLHICWQIVPPLIALLAAILSKWSCMIEGYIQKLMESAQYLAHVRRIHS